MAIVQKTFHKYKLHKTKRMKESESLQNLSGVTDFPQGKMKIVDHE